MRASVLLFVPFFAACQEAEVTKFNANPDAVITSHVDGDTVVAGVPELLTGQVGDPDDDSASLSVTWTVGGAEVCPDSTPEPDGAVSCEASFEDGGGAVVLSVSDWAGSGASDTVNLEVQSTDAPVADLTSPNGTGQYYADQSIAFEGTVSETEDAITDLTVTIETDDLGDLGLEIEVTSEGNVEAFGLLDEGEHAVRLRVVDTSGKEGIDSNIITVGPANSAPTCSITAPEDGSAGPEGEEVRFEGTANDVDVSADALTANWESDVDGTLRETTPDSDGTVAFATNELTANTHRIKLTVSDELGKTCTTSIYYTVGTPPVVNLTAPVDGDIVSASEAVEFTAEVSDLEDVPTNLSLEWTVDGEVFSDEGAESDGVASFGWDVSTWETGDHTVEVTVTDTDGLYVSDSVSFTINAPPNAPSVTINPDPATTTDNLFASATGSEDPDASGSVTYRYVWFADGIEVTEVTGSEFPSELTSKHHVYRVEVFASDGLHESAAGTAERTISNTAPSITDISVTPDAGPTGTTLTCAATAEDADGDTLTFTYTWSDGVTEGDTLVIADDAIVGDTLTCTATASDGDEGTDSDTATATVTNTAPVIDSVTVTPETGRVGDTLTCAATATDEDGDAIDYTYAWSTGTEGESHTITEDDDPGDTITCTATATDETGASSVGTASATVENTNPVIETMYISPESGKVGDTLTCSATATDADGDEPTITYEWDDGTIGQFRDIVDGTSNTFTCTATATDADGGSDSGEAEATLDNTDPVFTSISVTPPTGAAGDTLVCEATATDVDGDEPTITYAWSDGSAGTTYEITTSDDPGDTITCTATATDETGGSDSDSASATVENTNPVIAAVNVIPDTATVGTMLVCSASATDADGETPELSYAWSTGGTGPTYVVADSDDPGTTLTCTVTATDDDGGSDSESATALVENTAPTIVSINVTPSSARIGESLTCTAIATDADGGTPTITYAWSDGALGESRIVSAITSPGDTITCTATADDGDGGVVTASASATVENTDPTLGTVSITPATGSVGDVLTCAATVTDPDGGSPEISYEWSTGTVGSVHAITSDDDPGDTLTCTATATDEHGGTDTDSATATVENTGPVMDTVTISPEDPTNDDTLTCNATASDADGDDPIISYLWSSGYTEVEWTLTSATSPGDILTCTATATDASGASATDTASVTVSNRPPTIASVTIEPDAPRASDEVTCTATGAADPDGEDVTVGYTWDINDAPAGTGTTLSSGYSKGDDLTCTVTATDDFGASTTATASVTVDNTRPDVSDIVLTPSELFTNDTLTATPTVSDADGDDLTVTYAFSVDGDVVQDSESASLSGATYFDKSDTVSVIVTASDGVGFDTRSSDTLTVLNTAPEAPEVSVLLYERNGVESVSGGGMHTCSVTTAGIAQCWGNDGYDGQSTPPADTFESLSAGYAHNCGLTTSGNTECWGFDSHGQSTPPATTFESISAGGFHTCGVTSTGDLDCWGVSEGETGWDYGQVTDTPDGTFESVGAGYIHTCAITTTGNIACWGKDDFDQASPPAGTFVSMSVGYFHACGFNTSGSVVCWGFDAYGQSSPPAGTFASVSAGHSHTCGITSAGSIECWGSDTYGQSSPPAGTFVSLNAGHHHSCAVTSEGGVACWGMDGDGRVSDIPEFDPVDGLTCTIDEESTDADGDSISYTFDWDVDGDEFTDTDSTTYDGDTVPGDSLSDGGLWTCEVTPNDGEADGEFGSAEYENPCDGTEIDCPAASCQAILDDNPAAEDGNYWIDLGDGTSFETMCEMSTHGGGWTLIAQGVPTYDPSDYSGIYEQWNNNSAFNIEGWLGSDLSSFHTANTQIDHLAVHDEMFVQCSATGSCGWGGSSCGWDGTSYLITGMGDFNWDWETSATSCTDSTGITYSTTWAPSAHFGPSCAGGMTLGHWPAGSSYPWYCDNFGHNLRAWVR